MKIICDFSVFYLDETLPKGSIVVECGKLLEKNNYRIKMGYTVLLCFTLFKTGSLAKSLFNSH